MINHLINIFVIKLDNFLLFDRETCFLRFIILFTCKKEKIVFIKTNYLIIFCYHNFFNDTSFLFLIPK